MAGKGLSNTRLLLTICISLSIQSTVSASPPPPSVSTTLTVTVDGKPTLQGKGKVGGGYIPDHDDTEKALKTYLTSIQFEAIQKTVPAPDPSDPLKATLKGNIQLSFTLELWLNQWKEGTREGQTRLQELRLVRTDADAQWTLDPTEAEKIIQSLGIKDLPKVRWLKSNQPSGVPGAAGNDHPDATDDEPIYWIAAAVALILFLGLGVALAGRRRRANAE